MNERRVNCPMRHPDNGNCTVVGGFCTAVNDTICEAMHNAYDCGRRSVWAELTQAKVRPEPNLDGKCGSCTHSVLAEGVFGNSKCYVECKNSEHLSSRKYYGRPLGAIRQRTTKGCKHYKRRVDNAAD